MKKVLVLIVAAIALASCKNTDCRVMKGYTDKLALAIASPAVLNCTGVGAMQADIANYCAEKGLCKTDTTGAISSIVCPIVIPYIMSFGLSTLPADWKCSASGSQAALITACEMIPY